MESKGWIKLYRKFVEWEWYTDSNVKSLYIHLLINANREPKKWKGIVIERGQLVTGYPSLARETGLSIQNIRTALRKLKSTGNLTVKVTNKYSLITLSNYNKYQVGENNQQANQQATQQSTNNKQEEYKEVKKNTVNPRRVEGDSSLKEKYRIFIEMFNERVGSMHRGDPKSERQFRALYKSGMRGVDFGRAIDVAVRDEFLMGKNDRGRRYLTPEFITRPDKFENFLTLAREDDGS